MEVNDKIKEMAHEEAFKHYFSNIGDSDWPDDPDAFMDKADQNEEYEDKNGKCMNIQAPFEHHSISDIRVLMADFETALINFYNEAKKLDKE